MRAETGVWRREHPERIQLQMVWLDVLNASAASETVRSSLLSGMHVGGSKICKNDPQLAGGAEAPGTALMSGTLRS